MGDSILLLHILRWAFRLLSYIFLVIMIVICVVDAARSVGNSAIAMTSFNDFMSYLLHYNNLYGTPANLQHLSSSLSSLTIYIGQTPAWIILGSVCLICYVIGYNRGKIVK